jgi:hypothetical protein
MRRQPPRLRPWGGFSREALSSLLPYLSVALPGAAMICLDWWAFEALTLLAGLLPGELVRGRPSLPRCNGVRDMPVTVCVCGRQLHCWWGCCQVSWSGQNVTAWLYWCT